MDITSFVVRGRDQALLYGDYSTYHAQLAKRLLNSRKKLGIATKSRGKFQKRDPVTVDNVAQNHEYVHLLLLTSERAWAQAMRIKSSHTADQKGIAGRTRSHIVSRLDKAARAAEDLSQILSQSDDSVASTNDVLEIVAYAAMIRGAMQFEKQSWNACLTSYATARVVYSALATATKADTFKDLLSETIDPSIRYAAYQLKTPRTIPIPTIARKAFPQSDKSLVQKVNNIDPSILKEGGGDASKGALAAEAAPRSLTWRSREVKIEDAQIAVAWGQVDSAKAKLTETMANSSKSKEPLEQAAAYEEILMMTQDAVDATKQAIDELRGEGVGQGDPRMQSLQITRTAVNYEMISWRIGRNRVLTGPNDGAAEEYSSARRRKKAKAKAADQPTPAAQPEKELPPSRKLAKLKEKVALYEGTLQNLESVMELPGIAADEELASKIDAFSKYFKALKCLSIARSHAIIGNIPNALALINHSAALLENVAAPIGASGNKEAAAQAPLNIEVSIDSVTSLAKLLESELQRHRAIAHIDNLRAKEKREAAASSSSSSSSGTAKKGAPLIERLHEYPAGGVVDLTNIVEFPPKMALIPMKPIFLDVAWNYIDYPGKKPHAAQVQTKESAAGTAAAPSSTADKPAQQSKRGWFGFGRS